MSKMTKQEALDAGYEKFGYNDIGWQTVNEIQYLCDDDFNSHNGNPVVFIKRDYSPSIDVDTLKEIIAEHIEDSHSNETGDDTGDVYHTVKTLDFSATAKMVNESLMGKTYYVGTKIELTL